MSYYQGDYYQGDYYQGDPGLWSIIKKGIGMASKVAMGAIGLPVAAGAGALSAALTRAPKWSKPLIMGTTGAVGASLIDPISRRLQIPLPGPNVMRPLAALPGGVPFIGPPDLRSQQAAGCCPSGFHLNKQTSMARATFGAPPGSICVRNRSMNIANPRALRRGLRRVSGFSKLAARARKDIKKAAKSV